MLIGAAFLLLSLGLVATTLALELREDARQRRYFEIGCAAGGGLYFPNTRPTGSIAAELRAAPRRRPPRRGATRAPRAPRPPNEAIVRATYDGDCQLERVS